jgi:hypothetical protein
LNLYTYAQIYIDYSLADPDDPGLYMHGFIFSGSNEVPGTRCGGSWFLGETPFLGCSKTHEISNNLVDPTKLGHNGTMLVSPCCP